MAQAQDKTDAVSEDMAPIAAANSGDGSRGVGGSAVARQALSIAPGDYAPASEAVIDYGRTPEREKFDNAINYAKESMYVNPDDNQMYSKERGLGPSINAARLEQRGIDVPALVGKLGRKAGGSIKNYTTGDGKINLGQGRVSTASKGKKNAAW